MRTRVVTFGAVALLAIMVLADAATAGFIVRPFAGRGIGDTRVATDAALSSPTGVAFAPDGALLIADWRHHRIRRVDPVTGVITTFAGTIEGTGGNGNPADQARLKGPTRVRIDPTTGDVLIAEFTAHTVRRVSAATGEINRIAGTGNTPGSTGEGVPATAALLDSPIDAIADAAGNVFVADSANHRVRRIDTGGTITTFAGTGVAGYSGDGGLATAATLRDPSCLLVGPSDTLLVCDRNNHVIRMVDAAGVISTIAGTGAQGFSGDGIATTVMLDAPSDLALDGAGGLLIVDQGNNRIRRLELATGLLTTIAGTGDEDFTADGTAALGSPVSRPNGITVAPDGRTVFAEQTAHRIRAIDGGNLVTLAGDGVSVFGGDGGPALDATFGMLKSVTRAPDGSFIVSDYGNSRARRVDAASGVVDTVAGSGDPAFNGDGISALDAGLALSDALVDAVGNLIISDTDNDRIRMVDTAGTIHTIAGTGVTGFSGDGGPADQAAFDHPTGLELGPDGSLYIADFRNHRVRRVDPTGTITTVAGDGSQGFAGDGGPATAASLDSPTDVALDADGNLYIADFLNHAIRRVDAVTQVMTTVAGTGIAGSSGDGGPATAARLDEPIDMQIGLDGRIWVADSGNHRIRRFSLGGTIETVAGTGLPGFAGDGGPADQARFLGPFRMLVMDDGRLIFADRDNFMIRVLLPDADDDLVPDLEDNCPADANAGQADADGDGVGDACDACDGTAGGEAVDTTGCSCSDPGHELCDDANLCTTDSCDVSTGACRFDFNSDPCDDGDACTQVDVCQAGACTGTSPVVCTAADQCHDAGVCDPGTGVCSDPVRPDTTPCNDGSACTQVDTCLAGVCTGAAPVVCTASDQCHDAGVCDPGTGVCSDPAKPDFTACDDGTLCTQVDNCQAGVCTGADPVVCPSETQCEEAGLCDPTTGLCSVDTKPEGSACDDGNECTVADQCTAGVCDGAPLTCGDGIVQDGCAEACDDGADNGANSCCSATCKLVDADLDGVCDRDDACTAPAIVEGPTMKIGGVRTPPGDDTLKLKGRMVVPMSPPIDPTANGLRVLIEDSFDRTILDAIIPGGAGWKANKRQTKWRYANREGFLGIRKVVIKASRKTPGLLKFLVKGSRGSYPVFEIGSPLRATIVIDSPTATTGQCGEWAFPGPAPAPSCTLNGRGTALRCK